MTLSRQGAHISSGCRSFPSPKNYLRNASHGNDAVASNVGLSCLPTPIRYILYHV